MFLYGAGLNTEGTDIIETIAVEITVAEMKRLKQCIELVIENYESQVRGESLDTIKDELRQKAKLDKSLIFYIEEE